jgi:hypothetical protein
VCFRPQLTGTNVVVKGDRQLNDQFAVHHPRLVDASANAKDGKPRDAPGTASGKQGCRLNKGLTQPQGVVG